jgi:2-polyprenyl-3-methyl-5-hydroxy-6-metoxy-1,4-benzoquinol methylase
MTAAVDPQPAWRALVEAASAPYRAADRFAWRFARRKLGGDPVFRHVLERGLIKPDSRLLDIGCGQGLLASLLNACGVAARSDASRPLTAAPCVPA